MAASANNRQASALITPWGYIINPWELYNKLDLLGRKREQPAGLREVQRSATRTRAHHAEAVPASGNHLAGLLLDT